MNLLVKPIIPDKVRDSFHFANSGEFDFELPNRSPGISRSVNIQIKLGRARLANRAYDTIMKSFFCKRAHPSRKS